MTRVLLVGLGGGLGAIARYWLSGWVQGLVGPGGFPYGTLLVNVLGCFVIGGLAYVGEAHGWLTPEARLLLVTGFLGGFTTFSTFGSEAHGLARSGAGATALGYVAAHMVVGLGAVWAGHTLAQRLWG